MILNSEPRPSVIFYFSSRDIPSDFRYPLVEAWRRLGVPVYYILLNRRPLVSQAFHSHCFRETSLVQLPGLIRAERRAHGTAGRPVYFDSTGLAFPGTMTILTFLLPAGFWCYDLHDDYVYLAGGWRKKMRAAQQQFRARTADVAVHAAATLRELVPRAVPLGNASEVLPIVRPMPDYARLLVMGSIDERYDFDMLAQIAELAPDLGIDLWGHVSQNRQLPLGRLAGLTRAHPNIRHFGHYDPAQVTGILAQYGVAFAPYLTGIRLTRYIDPMRYYTSLNSGMELIATDIPMAHSLANALHVARSADDVVAIWRRLIENPAARRNRPESYRPITWDERARGFLDVTRECQRRPARF